LETLDYPSRASSGDGTAAADHTRGDGASQQGVSGRSLLRRKGKRELSLKSVIESDFDLPKPIIFLKIVERTITSIYASPNRVGRTCDGKNASS
jgi:hypothetical protein